MSDLDKMQEQLKGDEDIDLIQQALNDSVLEVQKSPQMILKEADNAAVKEAIWDYLPFPEMQCLHTIENLLPERHHQDLGLNPQYVSISNKKNLLFCYWNNGDSDAYVSAYALNTGQSVFSQSLENSHALALGNNGEIGISNDYFPRRFNIDTQEFCLFDQQTSPQTNLPNGSVAVCPSDRPLAAFWDHVGPRTEIELWDYEQGQQYFRYVNAETYQSAHSFYPESNSQEVCFSPNGSLLIAKFYIRPEDISKNPEAKPSCDLKVWSTNSAALVHDTTSSFQPMSGCSQHPKDGFLLYGMIGNKVVIQKLLTDQILFQNSGHAPCNMTSDGRIIAFCTDNSEVEVWDWKQNQKLSTLSHHSKPLLNLEISQDREFMITHSEDGSIQVWGIPAVADAQEPPQNF